MYDKIVFCTSTLPDKTVQDDMTRPLTAEGRRDSMAVAWALAPQPFEKIKTGAKTIELALKGE